MTGRTAYSAKAEAPSVATDLPLSAGSGHSLDYDRTIGFDPTRVLAYLTRDASLSMGR